MARASYCKLCSPRPTIRDLPADRATRGFVGRERELA
jgi:hypothetical protein